MARDPPHLQRTLDRLSIVVERDPDVADTRIPRPRFVSTVRPRHQREMLPQSYRVSIWRDALDDRPRRPRRDERERDVDFRILGKCLRVRPVYRRAIPRYR